MKSFGRLFVAGMVCAGVCLSGLSSLAGNAKADDAAKAVAANKKDAAAKPKTTVTGMAKAVPNKTDATKKHLELTDKAGATYMLLSKNITADEIAKYDGKNITVTGTVKDKDGSKILYVSGEVEEAK